CSRSGVHFITGDQHMKFTDERKFLVNHQKGLYFFSKRHSTYVYFLNPKLSAILFQMQKPHVDVESEPLSPKNGVTALKRYKTENGNLIVDTDSLDDGLHSILASESCGTAALMNAISLTIFDKERLISLTLPTEPDDIRFDDGISWSRIDKL